MIKTKVKKFDKILTLLYGRLSRDVFVHYRVVRGLGTNKLMTSAGNRIVSSLAIIYPRKNSTFLLFAYYK